MFSEKFFLNLHFKSTYLVLKHNIFKILPLILPFSFPGVLNSQEMEEKTIPDTAKIGIYIFSMYNLDFPGNKVNLDFYVWYNYLNDSLNLTQTFELVNSTQFSKIGESQQKFDSINYSTFRCNSIVKKEWNVTDFPFDKQTVEIIIEDIESDNSKLVFMADSAASMIDKDVKLEGWEIKDFGIKVIDHVYETNYGDPSIPAGEFAAYSRVVVYFSLERDGGGLFFKLFVGLFISVLISMLTFFVNPTDLDPRFGLSVGAIFAAIASQYVISSTLPQNQRLTLVDILHDISFVYIFISILVSTLSLRLMKKGNERASAKLDNSAFIFLAASYVILVLFFVLKSL